MPSAEQAKPYLLVLPYLPLSRPVAIADWQLTPIGQYDGPWLSPRFEELSRQFIAAFRGPGGSAIERPSFVSREGSGCDGELPTDIELDALHLAVVFAALDQNPAWSQEGSRGTLSAANVLTTDNADLLVWPIDLASGLVAQQRGFVVSTLAGGYQISDELVVTSPEELHMPLGSLMLESAAATAICRTIAGDCPGIQPTDGQRVARTIRWLAKAWLNTPSITWEDRIVLLKTGFEALTGLSRTHEAATWLRSLFEQVIVGEATQYQTDHLLWSPSETPTRHFVDDRGRTVLCTDLEHWFRTFAQIRNSIIHGDIDRASAADLVYVEPGSAYSGPLFFTAERLLREAIKVDLTRLGHDRLFWNPTTRAICEYLEQGEKPGPQQPESSRLPHMADEELDGTGTDPPLP